MIHSSQRDRVDAAPAQSPASTWSLDSWPRAPEVALVLGLGVSGRAAARLLLDRGSRVFAVDDRPLPSELLGELADADGFELLAVDGPRPRVDLVVVSPGVPAGHDWLHWARTEGIAVVGEIEMAYSLLEGEVVAITGSNGKSTTTAMTGALLAAAGLQVEVCGNIGEPLSARVQGSPGRTFVVELSSFQLETVESFRPRVGALLNLSADHLDRHGDFATYAEIKARIFRRQRAGDVAVLNADDSRVVGAVVPAGVRRRYFSRLRPISDGCFVRGDRVVEVAPDQSESELFRVADVPVRGPHNLENAMAAALIASTLGAAGESLRSALGAYRGLPHRMEKVRVRAGVEWIDDSKGTNMAATQRSLDGFRDHSVHLIAGGRNKNADPRELGSVVSKKACAVYLIGESAPEFEAALRDLVPCHRCETLANAVRRAARAARAGDTVLLSPACASFDQFENFAHRGQVFAGLVTDLPENDEQDESDG